jgi:hypothetical protein
MTSGVKYDEEKHAYRIPHPETIDYIGEPSEELDAKWKHLIGSA